MTILRPVRIVLHTITRRGQSALDVAISIGNQSVKQYGVAFDDLNQSSGVEHELFMALSELSFLRFGNCIVYQLELIEILRAFQRNEPTPALPATLGETSFCRHRPSRMQILRNKWKFQTKRWRQSLKPTKPRTNK